MAWQKHQFRRRPKPRVTYYPLVIIAAALAAGIVLDRYAPVGLATWSVLGLLSLAAWLGSWLAEGNRAASCCLLLSVLATGGVWHGAYWRLYPATEIGRVAREIAAPCCVEAVALCSPRWIPEPPPSPLRTIPVRERCELLVRLTTIRDRQTMRPASGNAELTIGGLANHLRAGDRLRIYGQLSGAAPPLNPGEFDFAQHDRSLRVNCHLFAEFPQSVERLAAGSRWSPRRWLADVRASGVEILRRHIAPDRARLAAAVLLGAREQLDPDRNEAYLVTGTVHILSISGLHVGILAALFYALLNTGLVPRRLALLLTVALTVAYAALTDLQPPVVRAAILVSATCLALWNGRLSLGLNALAGAAIVVLAMNPASLFQMGTQLSFLAILTMIGFHPLLARQPIDDPLDRLIATTRPWSQRLASDLGGGVWRLWLTGAVIWLISTPLVWQHFHLVSPVSLLLNCLIWPPMTLVMYAGLATLMTGSIAPPLASLCGSCCDLCLVMLEWLIAWGRTWPASHFWLASPPAWWVATFYLAVGIAFLLPPLCPPRRWMIAFGALWCAVGLLFSSASNHAAPWSTPRPLTCQFVAVGHGLGVLVELPDGRNMLYDSGRLGSPLAAVRPIASVLWSRGITHLDAMIISHADADHFNGIPALLDRFTVGALYVSPVMFDSPGPAVRALQRAVVKSGVPMRAIHAGQRLATGAGTTIEVLHPPRKGVYGSDNANSIVLLIESSGRRILLTGDLESPGLDDLLAEEPLNCDLVLAPHHGSPRSSPGRFADWCRPEHVVISGRRAIDDSRTVESVKNSFRLRGAEVYHTAEDGCITAVVRPSGVSISTHRPHVRAMISSGDLLQTE